MANPEVMSRGQTESLLPFAIPFLLKGRNKRKGVIMQEECQNIPECQLSADYIIDLAKIPPYNIVYFLVNDDEIVYVGQSRNGTSRIYQHRDKEFDRVFVIRVDRDLLDIVEDYYIDKFKPKYNKTLSKRGFVSFGVLRKRIKEYGLKSPYFHLPKIKEAIRKLNISIKTIAGLFYVTDEDGLKIMEYLFETYGAKNEQN